MAKVNKSSTRSLYIASEPPYQGSMTVWALRDFVRALDEHEVPDNATLVAQHAHDTRHFTGIYVRVTTAVEVDSQPDGEA